MITVTGPLWLWGGEAGSWHFLTVPAEEAVEVRLEAAAAAGPRRGFGSIRVEAVLNGIVWRTSIFPDRRSGGYLLPVKSDVRTRAGIAAGDEITVTLSPV